MNTKETIDEKIVLLLNLKSLYSHSGKPNFSRIIHECIKAIERGEKYEAMWKEFHYALAHINIGSYQNPCDKKMTDLECVNKIVHNAKQRHFPKEVRK